MQIENETKMSESSGTPARVETGFLCEAELLEILPVSRRTLGNWRSQGRIPFVKLPGSRRVLYHWKSIEAALLRTQRITG